jgi:hypothetical protein
MLLKMRVIASIIFITSLFTCCFYDSQEYLFPDIDTACDTANVTFSGSVQPILNDHCYACHSNTTYTAGNGIKLEDYADVVSQADRLLGALNHEAGYTAMPDPPGTPKLDNCLITVIDIWVTAGTPEN